jgi:hypothetical protein
MTLTEWHEKLLDHFTALRRSRTEILGDAPIFALEHGLSDGEVINLGASVREQFARASWLGAHSLPWIVYATELGYRYSGNEYWQTFEETTPGWAGNDLRDWLRDQFKWFCEEFGGARPSGTWASQFRIICWPITHAILPLDLQKQLARVLYEIRPYYSGDLLASPAKLGEQVALRSAFGTSRFQNFAQETLLVGQIAAALLLESHFGSDCLLLPETLERIGRDLDEERGARDWLKSARNSARNSVELTGLAQWGRDTFRQPEPPEVTPEEIPRLGIEPRLVLRPLSLDRTAWEVVLEVPDLSHLLLSFPNERETLADSRCVVAGAAGRPLARGRVLQGHQQVLLSRWPRPGETLLGFERRSTALEFLFRTECLLRPGPTWLFRIASDGLADEVRSLIVRPGQRYVVLRTTGAKPPAAIAPPISVSCEGVQGFSLNLPQALSPAWEETLRTLGLAQARSVEVWPAGLMAAKWDGQGRAEWLSSERPCFGVCADHAVASVAVEFGGKMLEFPNISPGSAAYVELPQLPVGTHSLRLLVREHLANPRLTTGELQILIRSPRPWSAGRDSRGPFVVQVEPTRPTLEQLWEARMDLELHGPEGCQVTCTVKLFDGISAAASVTKRLPRLRLPVECGQWDDYFKEQFCRTREAQDAYDDARGCEIEFKAEDLGRFTLLCERKPVPLRWFVRRQDENYVLRLADDSGAAAELQLSYCSFEHPDVEEVLRVPPGGQPLPVPEKGGLFIARKANHAARVVVPAVEQRVAHSFAELKCNPQPRTHGRSPEACLFVIKEIENWARARLPGDFRTRLRQWEVVNALTQHLLRQLAGEEWVRAENMFGRGRMRLAALRQAMRKKPDEKQLADVIEVRLEYLAGVSCTDRVADLASLYLKHLHLHDVPSKPADRHALHPDQELQSISWMCELALRLASSPIDAPEWAGSHIQAGLTRILEEPALIKAARFIAIGVDSYLPAEPISARSLLAGWGWR